MSTPTKSAIKTSLHSKNKNRERYDLDALVKIVPDLENYLKPSKSGEKSIDFANPKALKLLNTALLKHYYGVEYWEFSDDNLCPPIPGRADYLHYMADLLVESNYGKLLKGEEITCLDIGTGASCIYPILGVLEYDWNFIATDIDPNSLETATKIVENNTALKHKIKLKLQTDEKAIFHNILNSNDKFDITISNPPFHSSLEDAQKSTQRKIKNLTGKTTENPISNLAGVNKELVYKGGEYQFIRNIIFESKDFAKNCFWFSTLVSKQKNLVKLNKVLDQVEAVKVKTIPMGTGNKTTRILAWTFLSPLEQKEWTKTRWSKEV